MLLANTVLSKVILGDLAAIPFVSTNLAMTRDGDSNSSETAPETNIVLILIEVIIVFAIIGAGELALLLQQFYIIVFGQIVNCSGIFMISGIVMWQCCEYYANYPTLDYYARYSIFGSIFRDINNGYSVAIRFGIIFNLFWL